MSASILIRTAQGKYRLQNKDVETDWVDFDTAQDAIDCWDWIRTGDELEIHIDHRITKGYFGA